MTDPTGIEHGLELAQVSPAWRGWILAGYAAVMGLGGVLGAGLLKLLSLRREGRADDGRERLSEREQLSRDQHDLLDRIEKRLAACETAESECRREAAACRDNHAKLLVTVTDLAGKLRDMETIVERRGMKRAPVPVESDGEQP